MKHSIFGWLVPVATGFVLCISHQQSFAQLGMQEIPSAISETNDAPTGKPAFKEELIPSGSDIRYKVSYKKHKKHGSYQSWYNATQIRDAGMFRLGIPDGEWKGWYPDGRLRFIRHYSAEKFGYVKEEIKRPPKQVFTPLAAAAKKDPTIFSLATSSGKSFEDLNIFYFPPFEQCLHHGLYMNFYPDGSVKDSGYYKNGFREGHWEEWLNKGMIRSSGAYRHGTKSGTWSYFNSEGKLVSLASFSKNGVLIRQKFYE
jgi:antitoxin component YwqK of YwqJK toxin-antitoxin module